MAEPGDNRGMFDRIFGRSAQTKARDEGNAARHDITKTNIPDEVGWKDTSTNTPEDPARAAAIANVKAEEANARALDPDQNFTSAQLRNIDNVRMAEAAVANPLTPVQYPRDANGFELDTDGLKHTTQDVTQDAMFAEGARPALSPDALPYPQIPQRPAPEAATAAAGGVELPQRLSFQQIITDQTGAAPAPEAPAPEPAPVIIDAQPASSALAPEAPPQVAPLPEAPAQAAPAAVVESAVTQPAPTSEPSPVEAPAPQQPVEADQVINEGVQPMAAAEAMAGNAELAAAQAQIAELQAQLAAAKAATEAKVTMPDFGAFGKELGAAFTRSAELHAKEMNSRSMLGELMQKIKAGAKKLKEGYVGIAAPVKAGIDLVRDEQVRAATLKVIEKTGAFVKVKGGAEVEALSTDIVEGSQGKAYSVAARLMERIDKALIAKSAEGSVLAQAIQIGTGHAVRELSKNADKHLAVARETRSLFDTIVAMRPTTRVNTPEDVKDKATAPTTYETVSQVSKMKVDIATLVNAFKKIPDSDWAERAEELFDAQPENMRALFTREVARHGALMERALFSADRVLLSYDYMMLKRAEDSGDQTKVAAAIDTLEEHARAYEDKLMRIQANRGMMAVGAIERTVEMTLSRFYDANIDFDQEAPWTLPR